MKLSTIFHAYHEAQRRYRTAMVAIAMDGGKEAPLFWTRQVRNSRRQIAAFGARLERELSILDIVLDDHMDYAPTPEETKRLTELGMESYRRVLAKLDK